MQLIFKPKEPELYPSPIPQDIVQFVMKTRNSSPGFLGGQNQNSPLQEISKQGRIPQNRTVHYTKNKPLTPN